jgi:hypothetical protein
MAENETTNTRDVLVFGGKTEMILTYRNPDGLSVKRGDLVTVPFGKQRRTGIVLSEGSYTGDGLRDILRVHTISLSDKDMATLKAIGSGMLLTGNKALERVAPRVISDAESCDESLDLLDSLEIRDFENITKDTLFYPDSDDSEHQTTAALASSLIENGQVLVICPTKRDANKVASLIKGSVSLDAPDKAGAYERFSSGEASVGVGTRGCALYMGKNVRRLVVLRPAASSYIEQHRPHLNTAELAKMRAEQFGIRFVAVGRCAPARVLQGLVLKSSKGFKTPSLEFVARTRGIIPPALQSSLAVETKRGRSVCVVADDELRELCVQCNSVMSDDYCSRCGGVLKKTVGFSVADIRKALSPAVVIKTKADFLSSKDVYDVVVLRDAHTSFVRASFSPYMETAEALSLAASKVKSGGRIVMLSPEKHREKLCGVRTWSGCCRAVVKEHRESVGDGARVVLEIFSDKKPRVDTSAIKWRGPIEGRGKKGVVWRYMSVACRSDLDAVEQNLMNTAKRYDATWRVS